MRRPERALWPLVLLASCAGSDRAEVRLPSTGELPELVAAAPPRSIPRHLTAEPMRIGVRDLALVLARDAPDRIAPSRVRDHFLPHELAEATRYVAPVSRRAALVNLYEGREGRFLWSDGQTRNAAADLLADRLMGAEAHGVSSEDVSAPLVESLISALDWNRGLLLRTQPEEPAHSGLVKTRAVLLADLDVALTAAGLAFADALDVKEVLPEAASPDGLEAWVDALLPWHPQYSRLIRARGRYRSYPRFRKVWLPETTHHIGLGGRGALVERLRRRLEAEGFLTGHERGPRAHFGRDLKAALQRFQYTRGLRQSGLLDHPTASALNVAAPNLVRQIDKALDAWRQSPTRHTRTFVEVNLPEYAVELYRGGHRVQRHRAAIGYPYGSGGGRTRLFHSALTEVTLHPTWTPSDDVLNGRLLPHERRSPGWLARHGFEKFTRPDGRLGVYQRPSRDNALGLATLRFPNDFNIYLHGTPDEEQFEKAMRATSLGCVRVEQMERLVRAVLLEDGVIGAPELEAAMALNKTRTIRLKHPLPVHFEYVLVVVDDDGQVRFLPDIYQRARHR